MTENSSNMNNQQAMAALKKHGMNIVVVVLVVLAGYFGWQYYQDNYAKIDTKAADTYTQIAQDNEALNLALQNPDLDDKAKADTAKTQSELFARIDDLVAKHGNTAYAWQALMIKARHQADADQYKEAVATLEQALKVGHEDDGLHALTKLQLAQVLLANKDIERATKIVNEDFPKAFEATKQELLGDIHVANNDVESAKKAYQTAWDLLAERQEQRAVLGLKIQSLGLEVKPINKPSAIVADASQVADTTQAQANNEQAQPAQK